MRCPLRWVWQRRWRQGTRMCRACAAQNQSHLNERIGHLKFVRHAWPSGNLFLRNRFQIPLGLDLGQPCQWWCPVHSRQWTWLWRQEHSSHHVQCRAVLSHCCQLPPKKVGHHVTVDILESCFFSDSSLPLANGGALSRRLRGRRLKGPLRQGHFSHYARSRISFEEFGCF